MGTYKIRAKTVNSQSGSWSFIGAVDLVDAANTDDATSEFAFFNTAGARTARFDADETAIIVDGVPTQFASLPSGFTPTSVVITCSAQNFLLSGAGNVYISFELIESGPFIDQQLDIPFSFPYPTLPLPSILDLAFGIFGVRFDIANGGTNGGFGDLFISGNYEIQSFTFDLQVPDEQVNTGDEITVTSEEPDGLDFNQVTDIDIEYTDENGDPQVIPVIVIRSQTTHRLVFVMPNLLSIGTPPGIIIITIHSTQFSGSVTLGKLVTIYFLNAPGIYTLVKDKKTDTLYDIENGGTVEVKIPDPFAKTGFVGN